jgi:hypothetical protein
VKINHHEQGHQNQEGNDLVANTMFQQSTNADIQFTPTIR